MYSRTFMNITILQCFMPSKTLISFGFCFLNTLLRTISEQQSIHVIGYDPSSGFISSVIKSNALKEITLHKYETVQL